MSVQMFSFRCWVRDFEPSIHDGTILNAPTAGKAKAEYFRDIDCDWLKYTDICCRKLGPVQNTNGFERIAEMRQVPFAKCGMKVSVGKSGNGVIVGSNSSANFDVYFTDGKYKGQILNCHPQSNMTFFDDDDKVIHGPTGRGQ